MKNSWGGDYLKNTIFVPHVNFGQSDQSASMRLFVFGCRYLFLTRIGVLRAGGILVMAIMRCPLQLAQQANIQIWSPLKWLPLAT